MTDTSKDFIKILFKNHRNEEEVCFIKNGSIPSDKLKSTMLNEIIQGHETTTEHADCGFSFADDTALNQALCWFSDKYSITYNNEYDEEMYAEYKKLIKADFDPKNVVEVKVDTSEYYDLGTDVLKGRDITVGELCLEFPEWVNFTIMKGNKTLITGIDNYEIQDDDSKYYKDKVLEAYQSEDEASVFIKIK